jgi:hypothetical protein
VDPLTRPPRLLFALLVALFIESIVALTIIVTLAIVNITEGCGVWMPM